jgi:transposase InsO family protein
LSAQRTAEVFINEIIMKEGVPKAILTDNGTNFRNEIMKQLTKQHGIQHRFSTPYYPQSNGGVERVNRTIKAWLKKTLDEVGNKDWVKALPSVIMAINGSVHSSTNYSPFKLFKNREPTTFWQEWLEEDWQNQQQPTTYKR